MNRTSCFIKNPSCVSTKPPELSLQLDRDVVACFEKINDIYSDLLKTLTQKNVFLLKLQMTMFVNL